jgi:hypothetical protein
MDRHAWRSRSRVDPYCAINLLECDINRFGVIEHTPTLILIYFH